MNDQVKLKRESELRVGDIVVRAGKTDAWGQMLVLSHKDRRIKFARPYGSLSGVGTTCPTMYVGIENFETSYTEKLEWQAQYVVIGRDSVALMAYAHDVIHVINRNRLNKYVNVLRSALGLEVWDDDRIAEIEWVKLQQEAMGFANEMIKKDLEVPYPE